LPHHIHFKKISEYGVCGLSSGNFMALYLLRWSSSIPANTPIMPAWNTFISDQNLVRHKQDAGALRAVSGQTGTLVLDIQGQVLSATGELRGTSGEIAAETIYSMLLDSSSVLDASQKEELRRMTSKDLSGLNALLRFGEN
jgi:hypothetical protein